MEKGEFFLTAAKIVRGIASKIRSVYLEESYAIYTENVQQDLFRPCFFILPDGEKRKDEIGGRFRITYKFKILYYPSENGAANEEFIAVGDSLQRMLKYIKAGDSLLRGRSTNCEAGEKRLEFEMEYTIFFVETEEYEKMQEVTIHGRTKREK
ncbi:MAG: hypothetical protein HFE62_04565 [Firmicutes bacterium]|nr:hypothetical protein [Bacillota bacterium]